MADDNPSRTIPMKSPNQEREQMDENIRLITYLEHLLEDLNRVANELLVRGIIFEDETEKLRAAIGSFYNDPDELRNSLQELESRLYEFGYEIADVGGISGQLDGYVQLMVNLGDRCQVEMTKLKDVIAVTIKNLLIELNLVLDDPSCDPGNIGSKYSWGDLKKRTELDIENVSITMSPNVAGTSLGSKKRAAELGSESERLISTTSTECREETVAGSVSFNLGDDTTSSEEVEEEANEDLNAEGMLVDGGSTSSGVMDEEAANDPMNNSLESGLYTNIEGFSEEMNELLRKMNEDGDDESPKAINLKNLRQSLFGKPRGNIGSKCSSGDLKKRTELDRKNVSITMSPNVAGTSLGSEKREPESGTESERLISTTSTECREETVEGSVSFNIRDDTTSSEEVEDEEAKDSNTEGLLGEGESTSSGEIDEEAAAANDPMNNSLESGFYTNIEGLSEEMNELLRKMNEDADEDDESPKAINLKNLRQSLHRKPPGNL